MDPGSDEDHLAASTRLKVLQGGDSKEVKTSLLLGRERERERVKYMTLSCSSTTDHTETEQFPGAVA